MFSVKKEYHKKFNNLNKLKTRKKDNEKRKQEVLTNVGDIYNELYDVYKSKYSKNIDKVSAKDKKKFVSAKDKKDMLKVMVFCHLLKILVINMVKS